MTIHQTLNNSVWLVLLLLVFHTNGMGNPAAILCDDLHGRTEIIVRSGGGESGACSFNGAVIGEWTLFGAQSKKQQAIEVYRSNLAGLSLQDATLASEKQQELAHSVCKDNGGSIVSYVPDFLCTYPDGYAPMLGAARDIWLEKNKISWESIPEGEVKTNEFYCKDAGGTVTPFHPKYDFCEFEDGSAIETMTLLRGVPYKNHEKFNQVLANPFPKERVTDGVEFMNQSTVIAIALSAAILFLWRFRRTQNSKV